MGYNFEIKFEKPICDIGKAIANTRNIPFLNSILDVYKRQDILLGLKLNIYNNNPFKGKVILYNNLTQIEVKNAINDTKRGIKDAVLEVVTEEFINWKVNYLIKHLKNENEWYSKARKEIKNE